MLPRPASSYWDLRTIVEQPPARRGRSRQNALPKPNFWKFYTGASPNVTIYTAGLEFMNLGTTKPPYWMVREWMQKHQRNSSFKLTFVESCTDFGDPPEDGKLRGCPGFNCRNLLALSEQMQVQQWLWNFHSQFRALTPKPSEVRIGLYCNHGRHRSVGMSRALEWCLAEHGRAVQNEHLGKFFGA